MSRCCDCCKKETGRLFGVSEEVLGSTLAEAVGAVGIIGQMGTSPAEPPSTDTLIITIDTPQVGDSIVLSGSSQQGFVPYNVTDTQGNTYIIAEDAHATEGLDATVWIMHGLTDGGKLQVADEIHLKFESGATHEDDVSAYTAQAFDVSGANDPDAMDIPTIGGGFAFNASYNPGRSPFGDSAAPSVLGELWFVAVNNGTSENLTERGSSLGVSRINTLYGDVLTSTSKPLVTCSAAGILWSEAVMVGFLPSLNPNMVLDDASEFDPDGGTAVIYDENGVADAFTYTGVDVDTDTLTGVSGLTHAYAVGDVVEVRPRSVVRYGDVQIDGEDDLIQARIPHYLYDRIPLNTADGVAGETYTVILGLEVDGWVILDIYGEVPVVDASFIDATTLPEKHDGVVPAQVTGLSVVELSDSLKARWTAVTLNAAGDPQTDPVRYRVHISSTPGAAVAATLREGTGDGAYLITALTPGASGNDITMEVDV